ENFIKIYDCYYSAEQVKAEAEKVETMGGLFCSPGGSAGSGRPDRVDCLPFFLTFLTLWPFALLL
ncbi:hypothetical protein, partial [Aneurinibacillus tyrosinisolvens]|uniref:hypothetical protein n=1 Tax=Aneurinibacillus tyrosinisolvens TaxID=1443435 RepID=UPI00063F510B